MNKHTNVLMMERILSLAKKAQLKNRGTFIFGDPEETEETVKNTLNWISSHGELLDFVAIDPIILYPGSALYESAVKNAIIEPINHIQNKCPHVNVSKLSDEYFSHLINNLFPVENLKLAKNNSDSMRIEFKTLKNSNQYCVSLQCPSCSTEHIIAVESCELSIAKRYNFTCSSCRNIGNTYVLLPYYVSWVNETFQNMLDSCVCAMWPTSEHFKLVYEFSEALKSRHSNYTLINSNESDVGKLLHKMPIHSPKILNENKNITVVIVFSRYYTEIADNIRSLYSDVKPILFHEIGLL